MTVTGICWLNQIAKAQVIFEFVLENVVRIFGNASFLCIVSLRPCRFQVQIHNQQEFKMLTG